MERVKIVSNNSNSSQAKDEISYDLLAHPRRRTLWASQQLEMKTLKRAGNENIQTYVGKNAQTNALQKHPSPKSTYKHIDPTRSSPEHWTIAH